jgi:hypothetical protein
MATKQELEDLVADLQKQLEEAKAAPAPTQEQMDAALKDSIESATVANLKQALSDMAKELEAAKAQSASNEDVALQLGHANRAVMDLEHENKILSDRVAELDEKLKNPGGVLPNDSVCLDGKVYPVLHRNTVKELVIDYHKRFVSEEHTAVVIEKFGG